MDAEPPIPTANPHLTGVGAASPPAESSVSATAPHGVELKGIEDTRARAINAQAAKLGELVGTLLADPMVRSGIADVVNRIAATMAPITKLFEKLNPVILVMGEMLAKLPARLQSAHVALAERGWFYDPEMIVNDMWEAERLIGVDPAQADAYLVAHFEARLVEIERSLAALLPSRSHIFASAFEAHRRGDFNLSVLAFLAQADGVCADLRGGNFFTRSRKTRLPGTAAYAESVPTTQYDRIVHSALAGNWPINAPQSERGEHSEALNRHAVMHGESLDYGTQANSLKALSFLNYAALLDADDKRGKLIPLLVQ